MKIPLSRSIGERFRAVRARQHTCTARAVHTEVATIKTIIVYYRCRGIVTAVTRPSARYKCDLLDLSDFGGRPFQKLPGGRARRAVNLVHNTLAQRARAYDTNLYRPSGRDRHWDACPRGSGSKSGAYTRVRLNIHQRFICVWKKSNSSIRQWRTGEDGVARTNLHYSLLFRLFVFLRYSIYEARVETCIRRAKATDKKHRTRCVCATSRKFLLPPVVFRP